MNNTADNQNDPLDEKPERQWLAFSVICFLVSILFCFMAIVQQHDYSNPLYPLLVIAPNLICLFFPCIFIPLAFIATFVPTLILKRSDRKYLSKKYLIPSGILLGLAGICSFTGVLTSFFGDMFTQVDQKAVGNVIYRLTAHNEFDDLGFGRFILYRCDSLGLMCSLVHETDRGFNTTATASLDIDLTKNIISILAYNRSNGEQETAYSHQIE